MDENKHKTIEVNPLICNAPAWHCQRRLSIQCKHLTNKAHSYLFLVKKLETKIIQRSLDTERFSHFNERTLKLITLYPITSVFMIVLTFGNLCLGKVFTLGLGMLTVGVKKVIVELVTEVPVNKIAPYYLLCWILCPIISIYTQFALALKKILWNKHTIIIIIFTSK